jgi:hypothetical protein
MALVELDVNASAGSNDDKNLEPIFHREGLASALLNVYAACGQRDALEEVAVSEDASLGPDTCILTVS